MRKQRCSWSAKLERSMINKIKIWVLVTWAIQAELLRWVAFYNTQFSKTRSNGDCGGGNLLVGRHPLQCP